jgi:hypothetical protein
MYQADDDSREEIEELQAEIDDLRDQAQRRGLRLIKSARSQSEVALKRVEDWPDSYYLAGVIGSIAFSLLLYMVGKKQMALFIGLWPPTLLNLTWFMKERHPSKEMGSMGETER